MHAFTPAAARGLEGPRWLVERRVAAAERLEAETAPNSSAEEWRYSPISQLDLEGFGVASNGAVEPDGGSQRFAHRDGDGLPAGSAQSDSGSRWPQSSPSGSSPERVRVDLSSGAAAAIELQDGRIVGAQGLEGLAGIGVYVGPLTEAPAGRDALGAVSDDAGDYFTLMNDAFSGCPILVDVPANTVLDGPVVVSHSFSESRAAGFPRLVVRLGQGAQAEVLDMQRSTGAALTVPVVELHVGRLARLGYLHFQQHHRRAWQIASQTARVENDAALTAASVALGGGYARTRCDTRLVGRGASGDLLSAYFGAGDQVLDFRTYQDHAAPDTSSNLLYKGAVADTARSVYTGLIRVRADARGTNAYQTNRNLKLSDQAWAESVPNLEIENNEVRCSHASAVGPVDADQVFYLESRGVPTAAAERLIVTGFFNEVIDSLPISAARAPARQAVASKLDQLASGGGQPASGGDAP